MPAFDILPEEVLVRISEALVRSGAEGSVANLARASKRNLKSARSVLYRSIALSFLHNTPAALGESLKKAKIARLVKNVRLEITDIASLSAQPILDQISLCDAVKTMRLRITATSDSKQHFDDFRNAILGDEQRPWLSFKIPQLMCQLPFLPTLRRVTIDSRIELPVYQEHCQHTFVWLKRCPQLVYLLVINGDAGGSQYEKPERRTSSGALNTIVPETMLGFDHWIHSLTGLRKLRKMSASVVLNTSRCSRDEL